MNLGSLDLHGDVRIDFLRKLSERAFHTNHIIGAHGYGHALGQVYR